MNARSTPGPGRRLAFAVSAALWAVLWAMLWAASGCASPPPTAPVATAPPPIDDCEYRSVYVDADNPSIDGRSRTPVSIAGVDGAIPIRSDRARRAVLRKAYQMLPGLGLRSVRNPDDAYYRLYAQAWLDAERNTVVKLALQDRPKLARHMIIAMMADAGFPYRGQIGAGFKMVFPRGTRSFDPLAEIAMLSNWEQESEQLAALCDAAASLAEDGTAIEQLRVELIDRMKEVRSRGRSSHGKHLEIEVAR